MDSKIPALSEVYSCRHGGAKALGIVGLVEFGFFGVLAASKFEWWPLAGTAGFTALSFYLYACSGTVMVDRRGITKKCLLGTYFIDWNSVTDVWTGSGQIVFSGSNQRLTMPGMEFWTGGQKRAVISAINAFCESKHISPQERFAAIFMACRNTRTNEQGA